MSRVFHVGRDGPGTRHRRSPQPGEIGSAVDRDDPREGTGGNEINREDIGVGVWAAGDSKVQGAGDVQVVGVLALAGQQRWVFATQ